MKKKNRKRKRKLTALTTPEPSSSATGSLRSTSSIQAETERGREGVWGIGTSSSNAELASETERASSSSLPSSSWPSMEPSSGSSISSS